MSGLIKRDDVYKALASWDWQDLYLPIHFKEMIDEIPDAPQWIPLKLRPMDEEERQHYADVYGYDENDFDGTMCDCPMPEDGEEIWVCSKNGYVWQDLCQEDEGFYLEGNGDWEDIVAWMPLNKPKPYKGE